VTEYQEGDKNESVRSKWNKRNEIDIFLFGGIRGIKKSPELAT
jgi:hypothetical protein